MRIRIMLPGMSKGRRLLIKALAERGAQTDIARRIGVDQSVVSRWQSGRQSPSAKSRFDLERELGIPPRSWEEDDEATDEEAGQTAEATATERAPAA